MATAEALLTAEEFGRRPDPGYPEELVQGKIITMPVPTPRHGQVCGHVVYLLCRFLDEHDPHAGCTSLKTMCRMAHRSP